MNDQLKALEATARQLEPANEERNALAATVLQYANNFIDNIEQTPAYEPYDATADPFPGMPIVDEGKPVGELLQFIGEHVDGVGLNPASGGHLGYIPGGGIFGAALGDLLADVSNRYAGIFVPGPGAVRMENYLLSWMANMVGYPATAAGNLASGGSIANLIAIVTARDRNGLEPANYNNAVVYLTEQRHHCVDKALRIAGLGNCHVRDVPMDANYRLQAEALQRMVDEDRAAGRNPWLVVGNAGSTDTGAVDPLHAIGTIAKAEGLWFHIDAAYGGFFMLTEHGKELMRGIELSDSIAMDPHKGLFLPYGLGAVLVKDARALFDSHHYSANYIQNDSEGGHLSPADLSPELTKHFRGMRLWLPLQLHGLKPFVAALEEKLLLARYFRERLLQVPGYVVGPAPDLSVVIYRFVPKAGNDTEANVAIAQSVSKDGRVFISYTTIDGVLWLRLAVLAFRTHQREVDILLEQLRAV